MEKAGNYLRPAFALLVLFALLVSGTGVSGANNQKLTFSEPEGHERIKINNTSAQVHLYQREGKIKRIYGEAFSHGRTPLESAEAFVQANAGLLGVSPEDLGGMSMQPVMYNPETGQYKFTAVNFMQYKEEIAVYGSRLILLVKNEEWFPLVLASVDLRHLGGFKPFLQARALNPDLGIQASQQAFPDLVEFTEPEMVIWAGMEDMEAEPVLAYAFVGENGYPDQGDKPEKYRFIADAGSGRILYRQNLIIFTDVTGNVQGKATQGFAAEQCDRELPEPMPYARVSIGTTQVYADENGDFVIPNSGTTPVIVQSLLFGEWFRVINQSGSNAVLNVMTVPPGPVNFMHNDSNIGEFYRAQVNGYLQANVVRDFVLTYNPAYPGLQQNAFPVRVNETSGHRCPGNAWYDFSSINFCASGGGYPNTAFTTVIYHEYGHHLVALAGSGQGQYGEGMGDVMGILISDDPNQAYGFSGDCDQFLRTGDNTMQYPCSGEIHYCGQLLTGCVWSTRNELAATNPATYRDILSNLAVNAMLLHTGSTIDPSIRIDFLTLDDDNGNIYDGTPHYEEIDSGFSAHNMDEPDPVLSSGQVTPLTGYYGTQFQFSVHYYDEDADVPSLIQVNIDGVNYGMTLTSGTADNGTYSYSTRSITQGVSHAYYFYTEDGNGGISRMPATGTMSGPQTFDPELFLSGIPAHGAWMSVEIWGAEDALWGVAWSSQPGPFYLPASGLTYDIGPGDLHLVKRLGQEPLYLDQFGFGTANFKIGNQVPSGTKYIQGTTKMNAFWGKTNRDTFVVP